MISPTADLKMETSAEESRLIQRAQSGDAAAFLELYNTYIERIYCCVYFQVINEAAAESIASQVFRIAWDSLNTCQKNGSSFADWIQEIARNQVTDYYETNLKNHALNAHFLSVAAEYGLNKEVQDLIRLETMRNHLRFLTADRKQTVILRILNLGPGNKSIAQMMAKLEGDVHTLQVTTLQTVARFLEHLNLGREARPSPQYVNRTRIWLAQYIQFHTRRPPGPSLFWRMALTYTVLVAALLVTGTAKAQSALPGDVLYGWKRTSEQAWLSVSPDPVGTKIILADRRLNEWIAVENDPKRSGKASGDYYNALTTLKPTGVAQTSARITTVLRAHSQRLNDAGLSTVPVYKYLAGAANPLPSVVTSSPASATGSVQADIAAPTVIASPASEIPTEVAQPATEVPTVAASSIENPTEVPTEAIPAPTEVPTVSSPPTEVPTQVAPPATEAPTDVASPPTEAPTDVASPPTEAPTDAAPSVPTDPAPTSAPPPATQVSTEAANPVAPTQDPNIAPTAAVP